MAPSESNKKIKFWVGELRQFEPDCVLFLVGTKIDLIEASAESMGASQRSSLYGGQSDQPIGVFQTRRAPMRTRQVAIRQARDYLEEVGGVELFEISSKTGVAVDDVFQAVAAYWLQEQQSNPVKPLAQSRSSRTYFC
jgi:GTPase SAR1 family protein